MFEQVLAKIAGTPASSKQIKNGKAVLDTIMQFGVMPGYSFSNRVPYGVSMMKMFSMGDVDIVAVAIQDLVQHEPWPAQLINTIANQRSGFSPDIRPTFLYALRVHPV